MKIVFATNNPHKVAEVNEVLGDAFQIILCKRLVVKKIFLKPSPHWKEMLCKKRYVKENYGTDCFAEDTGLEIEALNGEPGVITARYAGPSRDPYSNINLVLNKLHNKENRNAQFRTVIALILNGEEYLFEGIVKGTIALEKRGTGGFGYDPIFVPEGYDQTFAELSSEIKNEISHRARATKLLIEFLKDFI
ncbi:MAG: RdgB/HAM1 family non-canonical purine NTP pyrophosphatase [Saprospiraceae bacterium]|nr:RdgB/HAM1 family non-canonical purine NTP pyrophosphatase [Saprospiraceae bacterium]